MQADTHEITYSLIWIPEPYTKSNAHVETQIDLDQAGSLNNTGIVGPVQQGLPLFSATVAIARLTIFSDSPGMSFDRLPAAYLALILFAQSPAHIISAVPLEPAARVVGVYPPLACPLG